MILLFTAMFVTHNFTKTNKQCIYMLLLLIWFSWIKARQYVNVGFVVLLPHVRGLVFTYTGVYVIPLLILHKLLCGTINAEFWDIHINTRSCEIAWRSSFIKLLLCIWSLHLSFQCQGLFSCSSASSFRCAGFFISLMQDEREISVSAGLKLK